MDTKAVRFMNTYDQIARIRGGVLPGAANIRLAAQVRNIIRVLFSAKRA